MNQATEIYSREFDSIFFSLPPSLRERLETRIREMGRRLEDFPHHRLQGRSEFRLRVGDYRIVYDFDIHRNELALVTLGHRRAIYLR
jgi:mRNA interferase RelE/StbE